MGYEQLFSQLTQKPDLVSALTQAKNLADNIAAYQKEQRTTPVLQALQQYAQNYNTAATGEAKQAANTMANQIRANYLAGGGSGMDLPQQYWGSDPAAGFQTTVGYVAPLTGYEGLKRTDVIDAKRQALMDALTSRAQEAAITGIDPATGDKTWERQYQEYALANSLAKSSGGGGGSDSGGSGSGYPPGVTTDAGKRSYNTAVAGQILDSWYNDKLNVPEFSNSPFVAAVEAMRSFMQNPSIQNALTADGVDPYDVLDEFTRTHTEFSSLGELQEYVKQRNDQEAKGWFGTNLFKPQETYKNDPLWKMLNSVTSGDVL